jgi:hypothetical protein
MLSRAYHAQSLPCFRLLTIVLHRLRMQVMRDWELGPTLGVGASCVTRLVTEKTSGRTAACKSISKQGILHSPVVKAAMLAVQREVAILQVGAGGLQKGLRQSAECCDGVQHAGTWHSPCLPLACVVWVLCAWFQRRQN